jgi:hypothetical protein
MIAAFNIKSGSSITVGVLLALLALLTLTDAQTGKDTRPSPPPCLEPIKRWSIPKTGSSLFR